MRRQKDYYEEKIDRNIEKNKSIAIHDAIKNRIILTNEELDIIKIKSYKTSPIFNINDSRHTIDHISYSYPHPEILIEDHDCK